MIPLILLAAAGDFLNPVVTVHRDFCAERPGLNTPACTVEPGQFYLETSLADWTLERDGPSRTDTVLAADTLLRIGVSERVEARVGWTAFGHVYARGQGSTEGVGDVTVGLKVNLLHPLGDKLSVAVLPYLTLPVGRQPVGAGDWGGGVLLPLSLELSDTVSLAATPEVDATVDQSGDGRHLRYGSAVGLSVDLTDAISVAPELQVLRDDEPSGHTTEASASLAFAVKAGERIQFDIQGVAGLNRETPDLELLGGVAVRF